MASWAKEGSSSTGLKSTSLRSRFEIYLTSFCNFLLEDVWVKGPSLSTFGIKINEFFYAFNGLSFNHGMRPYLWILMRIERHLYNLPEKAISHNQTKETTSFFANWNLGMNCQKMNLHSKNSPKRGSIVFKHFNERRILFFHKRSNVSLQKGI